MESEGKKNKCQYVFGDFIYQSGTNPELSHYQKGIIELPPKELGVLEVLIKSEGSLLTKDEIMSMVWKHMDVSDESLTRCVYILRKTLSTLGGKEFIRTVYGKGYRFLSSVSKIPSSENESSTSSIAIFPFLSQSGCGMPILHDLLIDTLSRYQGLGLEIIPTSLTRSCVSYLEIYSLLTTMKPDYYISGGVISIDGQCTINFELIKTDGVKCLFRDKIILNTNVELSEDAYLKSIVDLTSVILPHYIPSVYRKEYYNISSGALNRFNMYTYGRSYLNNYTPQSVSMALYIFNRCIENGIEHQLLMSSLAECYFALAQLNVISEVYAVDKINSLLPVINTEENPAGMAMYGITLSLNKKLSEAERVFLSAKRIDPECSEVYYYYALHLYLCGRKSEARKAITSCLRFYPQKLSAELFNILLVSESNDSVLLDILLSDAKRKNGSHPVISIIEKQITEREKRSDMLPDISPKKSISSIKKSFLFVENIDKCGANKIVVVTGLGGRNGIKNKFSLYDFLDKD